MTTWGAAGPDLISSGRSRGQDAKDDIWKMADHGRAGLEDFKHAPFGQHLPRGNDLIRWNYGKTILGFFVGFAVKDRYRMAETRLPGFGISGVRGASRLEPDRRSRTR